jgi:hypothetical protein
MNRFIVLTVCLCFISPSLHAKQWHVDSDTAQGESGTKASPFGSIIEARDATREARDSESDEPHTVILHAGRYRIDETVTFGPEDSGQAGSPIVYRAVEDEPVVFHSGTPIPSERFRKPTPEESAKLSEVSRSSVVVAELAGDHPLAPLGEGKGDTAC